jgi:hypothetical protein
MCSFATTTTTIIDLVMKRPLSYSGDIQKYYNFNQDKLRARLEEFVPLAVAELSKLGVPDFENLLLARIAEDTKTYIGLHGCVMSLDTTFGDRPVYDRVSSHAYCVMFTSMRRFVLDSTESYGIDAEVAKSVRSYVMNVLAPQVL